MRLLGLLGYAQHGKDSTADVLETQLGYKRYAFADQLRLAVATLDPFLPTGIRYNQLMESQGYELAKKNPEVRRLLQVMGTEVGRDIFGEDVWTSALGRKLAREKPDLAVVTDVRFPNEAEFIRDLGGELVHVSRPGFDSGVGTMHASEAHVAALADEADLFIYNNGTLQDLHREVVTAFGGVRLGG